MMRVIGGLILLILSCPLWAAQTSTQMDMFSTFGALIFVVAVILFLAWSLKKMRFPTFSRHQDFSIIRQLPIGTRERLIIVQAGEAQFLVGVTAHNIQLISKLEQPLEDPHVNLASARGSFANQLSQLLKKNENR